MTTPPAIRSSVFCAEEISHGFFGREGGVSTGIYASLNVGPGSEDEPDAIVENRRRCSAVLGVKPEGLLTNYQIHSARVVTVKSTESSGAEADALVTNVPDVALGVLAADCMPWLLADPEARVIGASHAGWRGALSGVLENTVEAMKTLGASTSRIRACLGPCIRQPNFEVGTDLIDAFRQQYPAADQFFAPGLSPEKRQFDLAGFGAWRLAASGVATIDDTNICTLAHPDDYFSYRSSRRRHEPDYGRNLSAIALTGKN